MPSFAIHAICGNELIKDFNISDNAKMSFFIGNIIPDVSRIPSFKDKDYATKRKSIQDRKKITHFRTNKDAVLAYPDLDKFLEKYSGSVKSNITSFAYFFHLYTDYYYFRKFLPKILTFYDKDMNKINNSESVYFVKINRTGEVVSYKELFNKENENGIYKDYSISNNYLIKKYNLDLDYDLLFDYIDQNGFYIEIEETKSLFAYYAVLKMKKYLKDEIVKDNRLNVFTIDDLDSLIGNIIKSFKREYGYIINSYVNQK